MGIRIEFYGIARQRAGVGELVLSTAPQSLSRLLLEVGRRFPGFGKECLVNGQLDRTLAVNLDGNQFVTDPDTSIRDGQCVLILSADAGG